MYHIVGVFNDEGPPVPIPNTAVKLISADNTWLETAREDRSMPTQKKLRNFGSGVCVLNQIKKGASRDPEKGKRHAPLLF